MSGTQRKPYYPQEREQFLELWKSSGFRGPLLRTMSEEVAQIRFGFFAQCRRKFVEVIKISPNKVEKAHEAVVDHADVEIDNKEVENQISHFFLDGRTDYFWVIIAVQN